MICRKMNCFYNQANNFITASFIHFFSSFTYFNPLLNQLLNWGVLDKNQNVTSTSISGEIPKLYTGEILMSVLCIKDINLFIVLLLFIYVIETRDSSGSCDGLTHLVIT